MPTKITTLTVNELGQASAVQANADAAAASASAAAASAAAAAAAENSLLEWKGPWVTATAYAPSDIVEEAGTTYVCVQAHTSGTFSTDLGSAYWEVFAAKGDPGPGSGDMLGTNNLSDVANATTSRFNLGLTENIVTTSLASQAEAEAGTDNAKLVTPLRVNQAIQALQPTAGLIGVNQTWQTPTRAANGTVYQNTTGQPIMVSFNRNISSGQNNMYVSDDGVNFVFIGYVGQFIHASFIVPAGHYYYITGDNVGVWAELR